MGLEKGRRPLVLAAAVLLAAVVSGAVAWRVLAPAEVSTPARGGYPPAPTAAPGVVARLPVAPLIVDGRLRVYAGDRQVYADRPVDGRHRTTPYWSYRRWPASLQGVVASGTTVVSRWSDGRLVGLDARTGRVAWRADGPEPVGERTARRTGAATVWEPRGLFVTEPAGGRPVVVAVGRGGAVAVDPDAGTALWRTDVDPDCRDAIGTTADGRLVTVDTCAGPAAVEFIDVRTGTAGSRWRPPGAPGELVVTLVGCRAGRSDCAGLRTAGPGDDAGQGWLLGDAAPAAAPALDAPGAELAGEVAVAVTDGALVGRSARTGAERWRRGDLGQARVVAVQPGRVHLLTPANDLVTVDPATGVQRSWFTLNIGSDGVGWVPGEVYAEAGFVAVERLRRPVDPQGDDQRYFYNSEPVIVAAT
ncbi:PQQ-binding-like beta-propeller repeat protein [Micromonospora endolithica]|uniref:Pyrrolo-quinoline quinone n=1 Tax=Micromonospora endolithica TaxID=230091 RepID=A0A3A9YRZ5_9ACTN|nr:PQQ-binding-like beta-propeller repeat protein [Micromonospora endolithica]RKN38861.1 pyrrolo-quinoline quinone [Micromonospora endolithica]TWJ25486.1 putative pyrroloquinoline-quinone binding quinoprotein [Micromonospora endolithica]